MQIYAYLSVIEVVLKLVIVYLLALFPFDKLKLYSVLMFGVCFLTSAFYTIYSVRRFPESHGKFTIEREYFNPIMHFAGWSLFGTLAWMCKSQGVNIVLNIFFGPIVNASYAIATQVNTAVNNLVQNFTTALNPQLVKNFATNEQEQLIQLIERGTKFSFLLLFIIAAPLLLYTNNLLEIWLKNVPENAVIFTKLIIINALFESFAMVMGNAIQATGRIRAYQTHEPASFVVISQTRIRTILRIHNIYSVISDNHNGTPDYITAQHHRIQHIEILNPLFRAYYSCNGHICHLLLGDI